MPVVVVGQEESSDGGNLAFIREKFCEFSGRYDLETMDGKDNGANFFINAGQKFLDRMLDIDRLRARYTRKVSVGEGLVRLLRARVVKQVYISDIDGDNKKELCKESYSSYSYNFPKDETLQETGSPSYWTPYIVRHGQVTSEPIDVASAMMDIVADDEDIEVIRIFPAPSDDMILEVVGLFYSPTLSEDNDRSFWSAKYPEILIQAALLRLEGFMRNSEGYRDQLSALQLEVQQLDFDHVAQQIVDVNQMEG